MLFKNKILKEILFIIDIFPTFITEIMLIASRTMKNNRVLSRVGFQI